MKELTKRYQDWLSSQVLTKHNMKYFVGTKEGCNFSQHYICEMFCKPICFIANTLNLIPLEEALLLGALLFFFIHAKRHWWVRKGGEKGVEKQLNTPILFLIYFFLWCVKSLLLCGFSKAFCLSWCLLHNSTQDALQARRERQRESQRAGWKGMYGGWALKSKQKQNKHWNLSLLNEGVL